MPEAREFVFFGADHGEEKVVFRGQEYPLDQQFGRALTREKALSPEPLLAYAFNGEPLTKHQGFPLRLLVPGWYGVANVKWLSGIHVQEDQYLGKYQATWYRTVKGEMVNGEMKWMESAITSLQLKSFVARVTKEGSGHKVLGVALNDGTPLRSVEVKIDDGPWQPAAFDKSNTKYSWKLFSYTWNGATPGEHTVVSRVTDTNGKVQPTEKDLETKKSFLEDNSQHPRRVMIAVARPGRAAHRHRSKADVASRRPLRTPRVAEAALCGARAPGRAVQRVRRHGGRLRPRRAAARAALYFNQASPSAYLRGHTQGRAAGAGLHAIARTLRRAGPERRRCLRAGAEQERAGDAPTNARDRLPALDHVQRRAAPCARVPPTCRGRPS